MSLCICGNRRSGPRLRRQVMGPVRCLRSLASIRRLKRINLFAHWRTMSVWMEPADRLLRTTARIYFSLKAICRGTMVFTAVVRDLNCVTDVQRVNWKCGQQTRVLHALCGEPTVYCVDLRQSPPAMSVEGPPIERKVASSWVPLWIHTVNTTSSCHPNNNRSIGIFSAIDSQASTFTTGSHLSRNFLFS
jgi:hypothetical protein